MTDYSMWSSSLSGPLDLRKADGCCRKKKVNEEVAIEIHEVIHLDN